MSIQKLFKKIHNEFALVRNNMYYFKGFIPEKNLLEIERFTQNRFINEVFRIKSITFQTLFDTAFFAKWFSRASYRAMRFLRKNNYTLVGINSRDITEQISKAGRANKDCYFYVKNVNYIQLSSFDICAPFKDFINDSKLFGKFKVTYEDPIVLYNAPELKTDGAFIVTAWGDEASDPKVLNENLN